MTRSSLLFFFVFLVGNGGLGLGWREVIVLALVRSWSHA